MHFNWNILLTKLIEVYIFFFELGGIYQFQWNIWMYITFSIEWNSTEPKKKERTKQNQQTYKKKIELKNNNFHKKTQIYIHRELGEEQMMKGVNWSKIGWYLFL